MRVGISVDGMATIMPAMGPISIEAAIVPAVSSHHGRLSVPDSQLPKKFSSTRVTMIITFCFVILKEMRSFISTLLVPIIYY